MNIVLQYYSITLHNTTDNDYNDQIQKWIIISQNLVILYDTLHLISYDDMILFPFNQ